MSETERALTPHTPGELPGVDQDRIAVIAAGKVDDVLAAMDGLDALELEQLSAHEQQGKDRKTVLGSIEREQARRAAGAAPESTDAKPPPKLGNTVDYAAMRGRDVAPASLRRPVLTLDGWVLPSVRPA